MGGRYVGFYWTLPVPRIGFRHLPKDAAAAAAVSTTIRYQRALTHRYVINTEGRLEGRLLGEIAFMDTRPDRATEAVCEALDRVQDMTRGRRAAVIHVAFDEKAWRGNRHLVEHLRTLDIERIPLSPAPLTIDGETLDPVRHFAAWRRQETAVMAALRLGAYAGLRASLSAVPEGEGRWMEIAERLNADGIKTVRGGCWTPENVRKLAGRLPTEDDA
ncbi:hypothetical protein [Methylobacterium sp. Leaf100]|uniref:hypothetical protein n=1 Tax=Methylobacterium sp. Leaf100 TaxID=1736252 RepID=UPI0006FD91EA|nr:hypothetical protein [Methylobacterium sp. Leaf100]KQP32870.1 hypothetical protein ASF25_17835 [Methylobacterium sp. Leaf100]